MSSPSKTFHVDVRWKFTRHPDPAELDGPTPLKVPGCSTPDGQLQLSTSNRLR